MNYLQDEFIIKYDFNKASKRPSHIFKIMSEMIDAYNIIDSAIINSIDYKIQPIVMLEDIEKGSILSRFKYLLESLPDESIYNLDWKKVVGAFLLKGKYAIIDFINKRESISTKDDIELLNNQLMDLSKEAKIKDLITPGSIDIPKLLIGISCISDAITKMEENENLIYIYENKEILISRAFSFNKDNIEDLLTSETISSISEMILKIKKPDYLGDSKWDFRHGKESIYANILDKEWIEKFRNREIVLKPGDSIRAKVKIDVKYDYDREVSSTNYNILQVIEVIFSNPSNQTSLF